MARLPSVRQLQYFIALEETGHFGRAAQACSVSQSAFSNAIREFESTLELQLVERNNRRVTITATGRSIAQQARRCLVEMETLAAMARESVSPLSGKLILGVIPTIGPFLLPEMMPALRREFPQLQLFLREQRSEALYRDLLDGKLDLLLMALPYPMQHVETQILFVDRFLLACRDGTALVDPQRFSIDGIDAETVLLLDDGHCLRDHALSACSIDNLDKVNRFAATSLHTLLEMVESDLGISFVPEMARGSALLRGTHIATYPMPEGSYREIALVWRQGSRHGDTFRTLGEFIRAQRGIKTDH